MFLVLLSGKEVCVHSKSISRFCSILVLLVQSGKQELQGSRFLSVENVHALAFLVIQLYKEKTFQVITEGCL